MTQFAKVGVVPQSDAAQFDGPPQDAIAAKFETQTPQAAVVDQYNLTPSQFAQQAQTQVQDAARLSQIPTAQAAASSFQSTAQGAQGQIGSQELVNANDIVATEQAVTAIAATMDTLNQQAVAQAALRYILSVYACNCCTGYCRPSTDSTGTNELSYGAV